MLQGIVLVTGPEPLLIEEALDGVRASARREGFNDRLRLDPAEVNWSNIRSETQSLSLFSQKQLVEIRLSNDKFDRKNGEIVTAIANGKSTDNVLLMSMPKLGKAEKNKAWFKAVQQHGRVVEHRAPSRDQLPSWVRERLKRQDIAAEPGVAERLAWLHEGNLLALKQEIDRLALLAHGSSISNALIDDVVEGQARFDVFALTNAALEGDGARARRILGELQRTGTKDIAVNSILARELFILASLLPHRGQAQAMSEAGRKFGLWSSRLKSVEGAIHRLGPMTIHRMIRRSAAIDRIIKGHESNQQLDSWRELESLVCEMSGQSWPMPALSLSG
ncbi:DNA polymerase III subunit delta [Gammaproteobacteria bacterium]|nr:DNA polymerase III subunit delta [Gammaproteobacteria bacterium]